VSAPQAYEAGETPRGSLRASGGALPLAIGFGLAVLAMALLRLARGDAMWTGGEGIYGLTARLFLHGGDLYGDLVAAQPPNHFLAGAGILGIHDSLDGLRAGMGALQILSGVMAGLVVWRLTGSRWATALTPAFSLLTPWEVHESATFIPELVALPLLLGATLLAARPRTSGPAGALLALAVFVKLPMLAPLVVLGAFAADRRRYALWALASLAVQALVYTLVFGHGLWTDVVSLEVETGRRSAGLVARATAQAIWNSGAIVALAVVGALMSARALDRPQARAALGLALGVLATYVSVSKNGTGLYVMTDIEAGCLPLAVGGVVWLLRFSRTRWAAVAAAVIAAGLLAQSASLLAAPKRPRLFVRPGAPIGYEADLTDAQVHAAVAAARACPPGVAYSGFSYVALIAHRRMPQGQPDTFILQNTKRLAGLEARAQRERSCP
jgi:hypothetical protein